MYQMIRILLVTLAVGTVTSLAWAQNATPNSTSNAQDSSKRVRQLVHQAGDSIRAGRYEEARQMLLEALALRRTPDTAGVLAQTEIELKRYADAAGHLEFALANFSPTQSDKLYEMLKQAFEDTKTHVGQLKIVVNRDGVDVTLDGRELGKSPLQPNVYVEPGHHEVRASQGEDADTRPIDIAAGKSMDVVVTLPQSSGTPVGTNPPVAANTSPTNDLPMRPVESKSDLSPVYWTLGIGGGLTAGALVAAMLFRGHASSKQDEASGVKDSAGNCIGVTSASCAQLQTLAHDRNTANSRTEVALAGSALLAVGTGVVTYLVWPSQPQTPRPTAWVTDNGAGFGVSGNF